MASSVSSNYSYMQTANNRISGLASGMDTEAIVEKLMKAQSAQMELLQQQKQKYEWKRDAYREVNTKLSTFNKTLFDKYALQGSFSSKIVNVSDSSKISATAGPGATGALTINSVGQLAKAATTSVKTVNNLSSVRATDQATLNDLGITTGSTLSLSITSKDNNGNDVINNFNVSYSNTDTLSSLVKKINDAVGNNSGADSKLLASFNNTTGQFYLSASKGTLSTTTANVLDKLGIIEKAPSIGKMLTVQVNGKDVPVTGQQTLGDLGIGDGHFTINFGDTTNTPSTVNYLASDKLDDVLKKISDVTGITATLSNGQITLKSDVPGSQYSISTSNTQDLTKLGLNSSRSFGTGEAILLTAPAGTTAKGTNTLGELGLDNGSLTLKAIQADGSMKETSIAYNKSDTIDSFISRLNNSSAGVTALFSEGKLVLKSNNTGNNNDGAEISLVTDVVYKDSNGNAVKDVNGNDKRYTDTSGQKLFQALGMFKVDANPIDNTIVNGQIALANNGLDASYNINGLDMTSKSNSFTVSGYNINLKGEFTSGAVDISSSTDIDSMVSKVKDFVSTYNDLITSLNDKIDESKNKDYAPLTDSQKSQMTADQITQWEEKAKSGVIRNDSTIQNALSSLRSTLYKSVEGVDGKYNALYTIGVTTTKVFTDGGKLEIDEDKLREALNSDPDSVMKLFTQSGTGVVAQMRTIAQTTVKTIEVTAGKASSVDNTYTIGKQLVDITGKISDWKDRLKDIENRYWSQFTAMEQAIQKANSQSSYLTQG